MLRTRALSAAFLIPIVAIVIWVGGMALFLSLLFIGILAWLELAGLLRQRGHHPDIWLGVLITAAFIGEAYFAPGVGTRAFLTAILLLSLTRTLFRDQPAPASDWAVTLAGALYLGALLGHIALLRNLPSGLAWVAIGLLATWSNDTGAYFVGKTVGRFKLWPRLSPKKTWEGLAGGLVVVVILTAWLFSSILSITTAQGALLGLVVGVTATVGDLVESMFKRQVGAKDSGHLIPGHGGMLDRVDSLLFVMPSVYYFAIWVGSG